MTAAQVVAVAFRLFAMLMAIRSVQSLALLAAFDGTLELGLTLVSALLYAGVAAALWFAPRTIAGHILSKPEDQSPMCPTPNALVRAGIVCSGLLLFGLTLPTLINALFALVADGSKWYAPDALVPLPRIRVASALVTVAFALVLVFAPDPVLRLISKVGRTRSDQGDL
jgi:hypothetical protein